MCFCGNGTYANLYASALVFYVTLYPVVEILLCHAAAHRVLYLLILLYMGLLNIFCYASCLPRPYFSSYLNDTGSSCTWQFMYTITLLLLHKVLAAAAAPMCTWLLILMHLEVYLHHRSIYAEIKCTKCVSPS